jgi:hypothetical protein
MFKFTEGYLLLKSYITSEETISPNNQQYEFNKI